MDVVSLEPLLELQQVDLARDRLHERLEQLPERAELSDVEQRSKEVQAAIDRVEAEMQTVIKEMDRLEQEASVIANKIASEEKRMYSGEISNPKELSAMQDEVAMLRRRKEPPEEGALEQMMRRDELSDERDALRRELDDLAKEADEVRSRIQTASDEIGRALGVEDAKRDGLLPSIPAEIVDEYEELRGAKHGVGVGALEDGICSACRESLSAVEVDRIKREMREGERLFRCEHCRRLLVAR